MQVGKRLHLDKLHDIDVAFDMLADAATQRRLGSTEGPALPLIACEPLKYPLQRIIPHSPSFVKLCNDGPGGIGEPRSDLAPAIIFSKRRSPSSRRRVRAMVSTGAARSRVRPVRQKVLRDLSWFRLAANRWFWKACSLRQGVGLLLSQRAAAWLALLLILGFAWRTRRRSHSRAFGT